MGVRRENTQTTKETGDKNNLSERPRASVILPGAFHGIHIHFQKAVDCKIGIKSAKRHVFAVVSPILQLNNSSG